MKGNQELVDALNGLLASELTSINQYMVHAEMAEDWGYTRLSENFKKRSITEMKHAERLIERTLFLEGTPLDELEELQDQIEQMTLPTFLSTQN